MLAGLQRRGWAESQPDLLQEEVLSWTLPACRFLCGGRQSVLAWLVLDERWRDLSASALRGCPGPAPHTDTSWI